MTELVRGRVSDRPWGVTLAQFEVRKVTGQLVLRAADGRDYAIAFDRGSVVGARSPQPADSATRIALTEGLVTSSQTASLAERIAATPDQDEIGTIAAVCRLDLTQVLRLRRRLLVQRAARSFSIEEGSFVVDDVLTIPVTNDAALAIREVIYHGARTNLTETRLATELRGFGSHFALASHQPPEQFGFDAVDRVVLESLRDATSLAEIEAKHRELAPRTIQAMIYALVSCRDCVATSPPRTARTTTAPAKPRTQTQPPAAARTSTTQPLDAAGTRTQPPMKRAPTTPPVPWRAVTAPIALPGDDDDYELALRSTLIPPSAPTPPPRLAAASVPPATRPSAAARTPSHTAPPASQTVPPPLNYYDEVGVSRAPTPTPGAAPARAPTVPPKTAPADSGTMPPTIRFTSPRLATPTAATPSATTSSEPAVPDTSPSEPVPVEEPMMAAARAYREGQDALSSDDIERAIERFTKATTLNPRDYGYTATLAWARFLEAPKDERVKSADKVRKLLTHAIEKSVEPGSLRLYLGWLERMLGHTKEALHQFANVRERESGYAEAQEAIAELGPAAAVPKTLGLAALFRKKH